MSKMSQIIAAENYFSSSFSFSYYYHNYFHHFWKRFFSRHNNHFTTPVYYYQDYTQNSADRFETKTNLIWPIGGTRLVTLIFYLTFYYILLRHKPNHHQHNQPEEYIQFHHFLNYTTTRRPYIGVDLLIFTTIAIMAAWGTLLLLSLNPIEQLVLWQYAKQIVLDNILCILLVNLAWHVFFKQHIEE